MRASKLRDRLDFAYCSVHLVCCILSNITPSGFRALTGVGSLPSADFRQLFPASLDSKIDDQISLREGYKSYKESYVKYVRFDPEESNLSE